jgi:ribosome-binding protein aMBF1 (putative translation factor)
MIKNEREYKITKAAAAKLDSSLAGLESPELKRKYSPEKLKLVRDGTNSLVNQLNEQMDEYNRLKRGKFKLSVLDMIETVPSNLIRARISLGWTHKELAERLGTTEQQIQKYEATDYESASFKRVSQIANVLREGSSRSDSSKRR